ncbi:MAG: CHAT domain-containing protein [Planctomycetes bacterium]|nr:CHAT domain-containing protein [Planctomycetota bacterium]
MPRSPGPVVLVSFAAMAAASAQQELPAVKPGETVQGELRADDAEFRSPRLPVAEGKVLRRDAFRLVACGTGAVTIEVRSLDFEVFAQIVDADGKVLAEDSAGAGASDARIVLLGTAAEGMTLLVVGERAQLGEYEVEVRRGSPAQPVPPAERARVVARAEAAVRRQEERHGPESESVADRCVLLARALREAERGDAALPHLERARAIRARQPDGAEKVAECWREIGLVHAKGKRPREALAAFTQCRDLLMVGHGENHRGLPALQLDVAQQHGALGERPAAIAALRQGIDCFDRQGNPNQTTRGMLALRLADALEAEQDWTGARACLREAVPALVRRPAASLAEAGLQLVLAGRLHAAGDVAAATTMFQVCDDVLTKNLPATHPRVIEAHWLRGVLAQAQARSADTRAAVTRLREALAQPNAAQPWGRDGTANALAELEMAIDEPARAVALLEPRVGEIAASGFGSDMHARIVSNLAIALLRVRRDDDAARLLRGVLDDPRGVVDAAARTRLWSAGAEVFAEADPARARECAVQMMAGGVPWPTLARVTWLDRLATCHLRCGDGPAAVAAAVAANSLALQLLDQSLPCLDDEAALGLYAGARPTFDLAMSFLRQSKAGTDCEPVFTLATAWQSRVLRGEIGDRKRARERHGAATLQLLEKLHALGGEAVGSPTSPDAAQRREAARAAAAAERTVLERQLAELAGAAAEGVVPVAKLRERLAADEAFVDYVTFVRRAAANEGEMGVLNGAAFVLRREGPVQVVWLGPMQPIEAGIDAALAIVGRRVDANAASRALENRALRQLTERVWTPLSAHLDGVRRVAIATEGSFATVPFAALAARDGERYLVEERELTLLTGAADLVAEVPRRGGPAKAVLVGGVDFGAGNAFAPLPGTAAEVGELAKLAAERLPDGSRVTALHGSEATVPALVEAVAGATFVHVATHGLFEDTRQRAPAVRSPSPSVREAAEHAARAIATARAGGIVLAHANVDPNAVLRTGSLSWLDLRGCELATLSACETGRGVAFTGEQVLGLRRALRLAGAARTMTTLWRIDDRHAAALVASVYRGLWGERTSPSAALRAAQLECLARCRRDHGGDGLPALWSGFVVEGPR